MVKSEQELESKQVDLKLRLGEVVTDKARAEIEAELARVASFLVALRK